jgi:hypothetical protein
MADVIPISTGNPVQEQIADRAYDIWLARGFRRGSPEKDLLQAVLESTFGRRNSTARKLFLVRSAVPSSCGR